MLTREEMVKACEKATEEFIRYNELETTVSDSPDQEKINRLMAIINKGFDGYRKDVLKLAKELTGLDLPDISEKGHNSYAFKKFVCFKTRVEMNSHNYPIGQVCMALNSGQQRHYISGGKLGNSLEKSAEAIVPATAEEIRNFVEQEYDALVDNGLV